MWRNFMDLLYYWRPQPGNHLALLLAQVEEELATALRIVERWAPAALDRQRLSLDVLRTAWTDQTAHLRTLERMLAEPEVAAPGRDHWREVRQRARAELLATLTWVRELASMVRLAWRAGAPAARAEELLDRLPLPPRDCPPLFAPFRRFGFL